ncbi:integrase [Streptomyces populi]
MTDQIAVVGGVDTHTDFHMEILGHSQIAVTMNVYAHVVQDTQREAVSHMDRLLTRRLRRE